MRATLRAVMIGVVASVTLNAIRWISEKHPWNFLVSPWAFVAVAAALLALQKLFFRTGARPFMSSVSELLYHVHSTPESGIFWRWAYFAIASALLALFGGRVGLEAAPIAFAQAYALSSRSFFARWFEQQRRTDAASAIAAGITALYGAPLAAIVLTLEVGLGGRAISLLQSVFSAFLTSRLLEQAWRLERASFVIDYDPLPIGYLLTIALAGALISIALLKLLEGAHRSSRKVAGNRQVFVSAIGVAMLAALAFQKAGSLDAFKLQEFLHAQSGLRSDGGTGLLIFSGAAIALIAGTQAFGPFGTVSALFWVGSGVALVMSNTLPIASVTVLSYLLFSALLGAFLGAPFFASVLIYELTGDWHFLLPSVAVGLLAHVLRRLSKMPSLPSLELKLSQLELEGGRSVGVLQSIAIRDAMVTDFQSVSVKQPLAEIVASLGQSKYPFLVVLDDQGCYAGLLTADLIEEEWKQNQENAKFIEGTDLLYKSAIDFSPVHERDSLSISNHLFDESPVIPVTTDGNRVAGLLFAYNVRIAYDREVGHRSMIRKGYRPNAS